MLTVLIELGSLFRNIHAPAAWVPYIPPDINTSQSIQPPNSTSTARTKNAQPQIGSRAQAIKTFILRASILPSFQKWQQKSTLS